MTIVNGPRATYSVSKPWMMVGETSPLSAGPRTEASWITIVKGAAFWLLATLRTKDFKVLIVDNSPRIREVLSLIRCLEKGSPSTSHCEGIPGVGTFTVRFGPRTGLHWNGLSSSKWSTSPLSCWLGNLCLGKINKTKSRVGPMQVVCSGRVFVSSHGDQ